MTGKQQIPLLVIAVLVGLGLGELLHASVLGSVALVAAVGILLGIGLAAWQRGARSN
ncbi:MAG TPA: hypothetical protein VEJ23_00670 [Solirubrobacteraceae bacterium]|nr:hypothetical protein [Solirubrobacteraceae bacterium]